MTRAEEWRSISRDFIDMGEPALALQALRMADQAEEEEVAAQVVASIIRPYVKEPTS